ncbi:class I SAM-dependent methyltransferase [Dactylosporangium sp. NPDC000521]|uniref:class I SAM-dependent methyltransferase n=1 Tax=Dactylosporangium sp. NPDC000521 TaxID=3363975 RepID=UPI0036C4E093
MGNPSGDPAYALARSHEEYERLGRQALFLHGSTERLLRDAGLRPGMRVLDVGSGAGDVAFLAAGIVGPQGSVVGVDIDGGALRVARGRAEALGLANVHFVEGDLDTAEAGTGFDAAVGRLVLMYRADPAAALRAVAARVRSGGIVAFQELDLDPAVTVRSMPGTSLWNDTGTLVIEAFRRAGMQVRMGRRLFGAYTAAGLPEPTMCDEALVGGGPGFGGYAWLAGVARGLAPLMPSLGLDAPSDLDTLADRLRDDAVTNGTVVWTPSFIGAHATKP